MTDEIRVQKSENSKTLNIKKGVIHEEVMEKSMEIDELNFRKSQMIKRHETSSFSPEFRQFVENSILSAKNSEDLDVVSKDISNFTLSNFGLKESSISWMRDESSEYKNIYKIDFTIRGSNLSERYAREKFEIFIKVISKKFYGRSYRRYKKLVKHYALIEGNGIKRFHIHSIIEKPDHITEGKFKEFLMNESYRISGFSKVEKVDLDDLDGLISYVNKLSSKSSGNFTDNIIICS